ncbi:MAG: hypothetical protein M1819_000622 [Sarea resinae]|nr:MAG: hypothetical protein M1819_000622 [Sarea resinae]
MTSYSHLASDRRYTTPPAHPSHAVSPAETPTPYTISPSSPTPKHVTFELLFPESPSFKARLPMRVQIFPHDTTDSIITTVKNFYGLYEGPGGAQGVSFEDEHGNTLIARYENLRDKMIVYVRVLPDPSGPYGTTYEQPNYASASPNGLHKAAGREDNFASAEAQASYNSENGHHFSRPSSRVARKQSVSPPPGRGRRSTSAMTKKARSRSMAMSRGSSTHGHQDFNSDAMNGYSSSEGGHDSVTSSRKARSEQLASAEISLDNIVEGGRRKRAKFESSELPLFVPPQVPITTSTSSISPQRRADGPNGSTLYAYPMQRLFAAGQPLQSAMAGDPVYAQGHQLGSAFATPTSQEHGHRLRTRGNGPYSNGHPVTGTPMGNVPGVLPTPDPTVASCISDEDVALQLMRLGDTSNISNGTRNSASTLDDALSGAADVASSTGATSDGEDESDGAEQPALPPPMRREQLESSPIPIPGSIKKRHKHLDEILPSFDSTEPSGDEGARADDEVDDDYEDEERKDASFKPDPHDGPHDEVMSGIVDPNKPKLAKAKPLVSGPTKSRVGDPSKAPKSSKPRAPTSNKSKAKTSTNAKVPISPTSLPPQSRKTSTASTLNFQHQLGEDEEDLSSKPRCQRCRKSKKGCDRQRPCQRCKDAGIGIEGCVSEDEGNGRKGRYGRHMGVPVKKAGSDASAPATPSVAGSQMSEQHPPLIYDSAIALQTNLEKNKKRKR